jgi:hypothetical protein
MSEPSRFFGDDELIDEAFRFALDSPLEGDGFELSVPRQMGNGFEALS